MDYLITEAQVRQLHQSGPPESVQQILGALPRIEGVSVYDDRIRRDEVSVWGALMLALPITAKVRPGGRLEKACSVAYKLGHEVIDIAVVFGAIYGCVWGYEYIQSQWGSGPTASVLATFAALIVAALSAAASMIATVSLLRKDAPQDSFNLSGYLMTELQAQAILRSSPPGYAIRMLDSLPVVSYYKKSEGLIQGLEVEPSAIEPQSPIPDKRRTRWGISWGMVVMVSLLWLAFGTLLSEESDTMAMIGSVVVIGFAIDVIFCRIARLKTERVIAKKTGSSW